MVVYLFGSWLQPSSALAYTVTPATIYQQAKQNNQHFMDWLTRYRNAVNMTDQNGDTAYCLALKYRDIQAQKVLISYGANKQHSCVKKSCSTRKKV